MILVIVQTTRKTGYFSRKDVLNHTQMILTHSNFMRRHTKKQLRPKEEAEDAVVREVLKWHYELGMNHATIADYCRLLRYFQRRGA